jgi:hypothetical protein
VLTVITLRNDDAGVDEQAERQGGGREPNDPHEGPHPILMR